MDRYPKDAEPLINDDNTYKVPGIGDSVTSMPFTTKTEPIPWSTEQPATMNLSALKRDAMESKHFAAYSVGHFNNDLVAGLGFTYQLYYLQEIVGLSQVVSGFTILSGQITDGLTTPLIGIASDSCNTRIGKRAPWYIVGSILVIPSFIGIFVYPEFLTKDEMIPYYIVLPAVLNVGWAFVQISNMSVVNSMTASTQRRDKLISLRNGFSFIANVLVLLAALIVFATVSDQILQFRILCLMLGGLGFLTSAFYILTLKEPYLVREAKRL